MPCVKCDHDKMDLKTAIDLSIKQYEIMFAAGNTYSIYDESTKRGAARKMEYTGIIQKEQYPVHGCFICQYVQDNYTDAGYDDMPTRMQESGVYNKNVPHFTDIAWCALYCPLVGILWDYRGCAKGDNPYNRMTENGILQECKKKHVAEMLVGFRELKERCEAVERAAHQGE